MSDTFDYGPLQTYEITWTSGHVETIQAHQTSWPDSGSFITAGGYGSLGVGDAGPARIQFHGEFDGHWRLVLSAYEDDIRTIRLVTGGEAIPTT